MSDRSGGVEGLTSKFFQIILTLFLIFLCSVAWEFALLCLGWILSDDVDRNNGNDLTLGSRFCLLDMLRRSKLRPDYTGKVGISPLMKCTFAIHQMVYDSVPDALDEYLQMEFLRQLSYSDIEKLYARHEEKHGYPGMIGNIDCTDWSWENFPIALRTQFCKGDHGPDPFILFGKAPDVQFVAKEVTYKRAYYQNDGIYPEWYVLMKSISNPESNDHKRIMYKTAHEAARKDLEQAFGILKTK
ncbi:ALP1-like protein [Tanacetum coccineum]